MNLKYLFIALTAFLVAGCESASRFKEERSARAAADSFATYYFNWQFQKAARFVTDSSQVWLRYAASQVHEADIKSCGWILSARKAIWWRKPASG